MSFTISINDQAAFEVQFAGPAGPTGPQGIQGIQGVPGPGVAAGGTTGQVLKKLSSTNYDTGWSSDISGVAWGAITGTLSAQTDLQTALDAKLSTSAASSTYLPLAGGYITGDIQSINGSGYRSYNGTYLTAVLNSSYLQLNNSDTGGTLLTVESSGITFPSGKQTVHYPGLSILSGYATETYVNSQGFITLAALAGYATESWVTTNFYPLAGNPSGFLTASALTPYSTTVQADALYYPLTGNPSAFLVAADLAGYATESWVTGELADYLPLAGGAMTGSITSTGTTYDTEMAGDFFGVQLSADHTQGTMVNFDGLHTYDGPNSVYVKPTGITFPDATMQTTAYTGTSPTAWGSITGTLSDQTDLQSALDAKYDASNPAGFITQGTADGLYYSISNPSGFITSGDLAGYATESFVTSQGYITASALTGYATESWVQSQGYLYPDANGVIQYPNGVLTDPTFPVGRFWYQSQKFRWTDGVAIRTVASESYVTTALGSYAPLAGATFTGKITGATISVGTPSVNIGGQCDSAPASATNGDLWISNATAPKLTYRMGGVNYNLPVLNQFNTFTNQMVIDTSSATTAALRVTQRGAGNAIEVEDSTTPDATKFVVDQFGKVGIGTAPDATAAIKIDGTGISFNGLVFNPTATAAHSGGSDTLDLLVTINGTAYRLGLRPA